MLTRVYQFLKKDWIFLIFLFTVIHVNGQFTTQGGITPTNLVQNVLVGSGLSTGVVTSTGGANQFVKFWGGGPSIGIDSGIVLTTCGMPGGTTFSFNVPSANVPPNSSTNITAYPLLQTIAGSNINNVAALQFTFTPQSDTLKFVYVFASEEYNTYVNSFNDAFGFFLTGPKPGGGNYTDQNVAIVPGTVNTPVTINNVNNGQNFGCALGPCTNCLYYVDNLCVGSPGYNNFVFNGYTKPITAIAPVIPCSTYTIKLAVANALDNAFNSAVFLKANSFSATGFQLSVNQNSTSAIDTIVYEGCGDAILEIQRTNNINSPLTVPLNITGSATNGVDYNAIPNSITFAAGQSTYFLTIDPILDLIPEGNETITISVTSTACSGGSSSVTFLIKDYEPLTVDAGNDTIMTCTGGVLTANYSGGIPGLIFNWDNGAGNSPVFPIQPTSASWHYVTLTDTCGISVTDSIFVDYWEPEFVGYSIGVPSATSVIEGCGTSTLTIFRTENIQQTATYPIDISGTAQNGVDYTFIPGSITFAAGDSSVTLTIQPTYDMITEGSETFILSINDTLCDGTLIPFSQTIVIKNLDPVNVDAGNDILMDCPHNAIDLIPVYTGGWPPFTYSWDFGGTTSFVNVFPSDTTTYIITVTDSCGYSDQDEITINVAHDPIADYRFNDIIYCEPADILFENISLPVSGQNLTYLWRFDDGTESTSSDPNHIFQNYGDYMVTLIVTNEFNCKDSVTYNVIVKPIPTAVPQYSPQNPTTLNPDVVFWDESYPNIQSWYWETGDGNTFNSNTFNHTYDVPGEYTAYLEVTNEWGCSDSISFTIIVEEETSIYIPNSFTPNDDGLNDIFYVYGTNWRTMEFIIFDRWGLEVFRTDNPDKGWDGKLENSNEYLMNGTYAYKIYIVDFYGKEYEYMGHINLIR